MPSNNSYTIEQINNKKPDFSRLTALYFSEKKYKKQPHVRFVVCKCICGNIKTFQLNKITTGATKSCGCLLVENKGISTKYSVMNKSIRSTYNGMMNRCYYKNGSRYKDYGGRGVIVCDDWRKNYQSFLTWCLNNGWKKGLHLDKDIKGNGLLYSPETCCFVTPTENANHKSTNIVVICNDEKMSLKNACRFLKLNYYTIRGRITTYGLSFEEAITFPKNVKFKKYKEKLLKESKINI